MQHPFGGGREGSGMFPVPAGYDEDAIGRALRAMQQDAPAPGITHPHPTPVMGPPPIPLPPPTASGNPQVTEMFLAALPWLQFLQIQQQAGPGQLPHPSQGPMPPMHGQQHTPHHTLHPQQHQELPAHQQQQQRTLSELPSQFGMMPPRRPSSQPQQHAGFSFMPSPHQPQIPSFSAGHFGMLPPPEASRSRMEGMTPLPPMQRSASVGNTPSPEAQPHDPAETDGAVITEDKRRRNTAASARFRIKKKQWTLNLERTIGDLSGRVEELEREASELRRENGWLKEIVMLKSKRLAGIVPELEPSSSGSGSGGAGSGSGGPGGEKTPEEEESEDEADEADQQRTRSGRNDKGKGRQQR
ncbi:hypothetical protein LXA43DRAFT_980953 [Ganoderma leucocontextum]|nr:hypothetical protein LXA43DRAFT_980953 [Ganoderma leucocontextum]